MGHYLSEMEPDWREQESFVCSYCRKKIYGRDHSCVPYLIERIERIEGLLGLTQLKRGDGR